MGARPEKMGLMHLQKAQYGYLGRDRPNSQSGTFGGKVAKTSSSRRSTSGNLWGFIFLLSATVLSGFFAYAHIFPYLVSLALNKYIYIFIYNLYFSELEKYEIATVSGRIQITS
jgi:hypothetical protein